MYDLAPIALFVYKRPEHTQRVIESLLKNDAAKYTIIYAFSDAAKNENESKDVDEVRKLIKQVSGFKEVVLIDRKTNFGLAKSIIEGVSQVLDEYKRAIIVEDDLVVSQYFLQYMNSALDIYENEYNVISIHGYIYPLKKILPETFFLRGADCWGWATWKRGWDLFESDPQKLLYDIYKNKLEKDFDLNGAARNVRMLKRQAKGKIDSWAIRWHASAYLNNKFTLYPGRSLVQNIGMGKQSTHTKKTNVYDVELSPNPIKVEKIEVRENEFVKNEIEKYFRSINLNFIKKIFQSR